ncbi:hypothetical protein [Caulobacter sp. CCUG 60055]|uniref:hypothetical protein n=1 Tax=Caulobacter sp. CCUG 60055 TaxID=2100090 RepID=UPI001FA6BD8B|nr:hypothetical protein [Caulobacter sp. CCUG 60055]MBQ1543253.1 hypothetical protein [Caulobacteraceae bacterium]
MTGLAASATVGWLGGAAGVAVTGGIGVAVRPCGRLSIAAAPAASAKAPAPARAR